MVYEIKTLCYLDSAVVQLFEGDKLLFEEHCYDPEDIDYAKSKFSSRYSIDYYSLEFIFSKYKKPKNKTKDSKLVGRTAPLDVSGYISKYLKNRPKGYTKDEDERLCYEGAILNSIYLHDKGYNCTIHLGHTRKKDEGVTHAWVECKGRIFQSRKPKNGVEDYYSEASAKIEDDMNDNEIKNRIEQLFNSLEVE